MLPVVFAVALYEMSPQAQAVTIVASASKKPPVVRRVNVAGRYATVLTSGGTLEGAPVTSPILFERFSFGWQAIGFPDERCLAESMQDKAVAAHLFSGMRMESSSPTKCSNGDDSGPRVEVEAVRRLMRGPLVPFVAVVGDWALGTWDGGEEAGESLYHKRHGQWRLVTSGGGVIDAQGMREYGVPQADWCRLRAYNAICH